MADAVDKGDSFEGSVEYMMPPPETLTSVASPDDPEVYVRASYRIGNTYGQGAVRIIGTLGGQ